MKYNDEAWMNASTSALSPDCADKAGNKNPQTIKYSKSLLLSA